MTWKDKLKQLKQEFEGLSSGNASQPPAQGYPGHGYQGSGQPQGYGQPQPQPPPQSYGQPQVYWQPQFRPDFAVTAEWDAKLGNGPDGWGNQELEHYTALPQNTF